MKKLAFIDLDGIVVDNSAREAEAMIAARNCFNFPDEDMNHAIPSIRFPEAWKAIFFSKIALYNPEFIKLDTLMEGVKEALETLEGLDYHILFLTSRPDTKELRQATVDWFWSLRPQIVLLSDEDRDQLLMKPTAFIDARVTTKAWKTGIIQQFTRFYHASDVIVIDDDSSNLDTARLYKDGQGFMFSCFDSFKNALETLRDWK